MFRESRPALVLHGNPSINHLDPRLLETKAQRVLRREYRMGGQH